MEEDTHVGPGRQQRPPGLFAHLSPTSTLAPHVHCRLLNSLHSAAEPAGLDAEGTYIAYILGGYERYNPQQLPQQTPTAGQKQVEVHTAVVVVVVG